MKMNISHHLNPQAAVRHGGLSITSGTAASVKVKWRMSFTHEEGVWFSIHLFSLTLQILSEEEQFSSKSAEEG